jgi:serine/threonine protein kinase
MIGKRIGKYQITEELGRGGMGIVYKATQVTLNRTVALKVLFPHLAKSGEYLGRFRREAVTLAKVQHDNIVHIYDVEEFEGVSCIVMEYVGGPPLTKILAREQRLDPSRVCEIGVALASGLEAAHQQGIVHRDIKPDNILFSSHGRPKLTDFGIAHMRDDGVHTRTGIMLGTPYYMSPEQARGRPVTAASDIYSLGVVLFEALTGQVPFHADDSLAVALMHLNEPAPQLTKVAPWVPPRLAELVNRALEKEPARRFTSSRDFATALSSVSLAGGSPIPLHVTTTMPCPECSGAIRDDFLTCPRCALAIRQRCAECSRLYDPLSPECPFCRTPATPGPQPIPMAAIRPVPASSLTEAPSSNVVSGESTIVGAFAPAAAAVRERVAGAMGPLLDNMHDAIDRLPPPPTSTAIRRAIDSSWTRLRDGRWAGIPVAVWVGVALLAFALIAMVSSASGRGTKEVANGGLSSPESGGPGSSYVSAAPPTGRQPRTRQQQQQAMTPAERERAGDVLTSLLDPDSAATKAAADSAKEEPPATTRQAETGADAEKTEPRTSPEKTGAEKDPAAEAAVAEAAARIAIAGIVERQRVATEHSDIDMLLRDISPDLQAAARESFGQMVKTARDFRSETRDLEVDFDDASHANVRFHVKLTAVRRSDGRRVTIHDGPVDWQVAKVQGRWLIVGLG